ncbi:MAG: hypothetical protein NW218_08695 [Saprospiraceae bacterium]|nr:hypothetical protein [Saprospiraceae bacterium]
MKSTTPYRYQGGIGVVDSPYLIDYFMAEKKSFVLRMDVATYEALEKWAADEFRSVNGQLEWMIQRALKEAGRAPKAPQPKDDATDPA